MNRLSPIRAALAEGAEAPAATRLPARRPRDLPLRIVMAAPPEGDPGTPAMDVRAFRINPQGDVTAPSALRVGMDTGSVFLLDFGTGDEVMLLAGAEARWLPRGEGGTDLLERASRGAGAWRREQVRDAHRLRLPERLIAYSDDLAGAQLAGDVARALVEHCPRIVGGFCALLFAADAAGEPLRLWESGGDDPALRLWTVLRSAG